ncbi:hypothetical protein MN116_001943 [Schistosoma mekongi]|uniref:Nucleoporin SEH1 n=1 Tax=Schistosoma mekongi TaxID=38744 RepID=A0AAE1ZJ40_SCHME|nr:hypothetical protein MN116_001943 [Schistosoma mekongi]
MFVSSSIQANHADLIHDVAYDFYGRRMATCSSDQMIKIWDLKDNEEWVCTASWRCHLGSAWRVTWAHPEFGQVIATCSFDRTIAVWEEIAGAQTITSGGENDGSANQTQSTVTNTMCGGQLANTHWIRRAYLVDPRTSVTGLQFAPRHLGLQLAAISTDGMLRIYEALDVMNLSQWRLQFDFGTKMSGSCLAWSQSRLDPPLIAVGSVSPNDPDAGDNSDNLQTHHSMPHPAHPTNSLINGKLVLYEYSEARRHWYLVEDVHALNDPIYDVSFAPHMGQSYHTLAVGSRELYLLRIRPSSYNHTSNSVTKNDNSSSNSLSLSRSNIPVRNPYEIRMMARFDHHEGRVWHVSWNVTGSLLASSGDDGCVRLWQANYLGVWLPVSVISPDGSRCTTTLQPSGQDDLSNCLLKSCFGPMKPPRTLSSAPPIRMPPISTSQMKQNEHAMDHVEQTTNINLPKGSLHECTVPFQKLAPIPNPNQPGVWH